MTNRLYLKNPVQNGSELITELVFQPLKAKHIRQTPTDITMNYLINLAGTLTGTPPSVMDELSSEDTFHVLEVVKSFFQHSLETGAEK